MRQDIFEFWAEVAPTDTTHPRDRYALDRVAHGFDLRCLPSCFGGPLRSAPVVLLYLSPGFSEDDVKAAETPEAQARFADLRTGHQPLPGPDEYEPAWKWWSLRTKVFGPWEKLRDKIAILNISGYHSKKFTHSHVLAALPSCRATLDWAQSVLFPQAECGERVVVCMRAARYWGLGGKHHYGQSLFAPSVVRGGHMQRTTTREAVVGAVRAKLGLS